MAQIGIATCHAVRFALVQQDAEEGARADRHGEGVRQTCATFATCSERKGNERIGQARQAPGIGQQDGTEAFSEGSLRAIWDITEEAPDPQGNGKRVLGTREIGHGARVPAMDTCTDRATLRTTASMLGRPSGDRHPVVLDADGVKLNLGEWYEK